MTEIEVKLTINEEGYRDLISSLSMNITGILRQNNIFFETKDNKLTRNARLRSIKTAEMPTRWVFTSKGPGKMVNGIAERSEIEEDITAENAEKMLSDTKNLYKYLPPTLQEVLEPTKDSEFVILGNFLSIRRVIPYDSIVIEADECLLPNNEKYYEIEVESTNPEEAKTKIVTLLKQLGAKFENSKKSKFAKLLAVEKENRIKLDL